MSSNAKNYWNLSWPGLTIYTVLYCFLVATSRFPYSDVEAYWHSLGRGALLRQPLQSLWWNHIQPPGLNALYAIAYRLPDPALAIQLLFFLAGAGTIFFLVATLLESGLDRTWSRRSGILFSLLPTTVLYTYLPYNTLLVSLGSTIISLGLVLTLRGQPSGTTWYACGTVFLFLIRPSFSFLVAVIWLLIPLLTKDRDKIRRAPLVTAIVLCLAIQLHYFSAFGMLTTSSFSGTNAVVGMVSSGAVSAQDLDNAAKGDPCLEEIVAQAKLGRFWWIGPAVASTFPSCIIEYPVHRDNLLVHQYNKLDGNLTFNTPDHLAVSKGWNHLATKLVTRHFGRFLAIPLGFDDKRTTLEIALSSGQSYPTVSRYLGNTFPVFAILRPIGTLFPPCVVGLILVTSIFKIRRKKNDMSTMHTKLFWRLVVLLGLTVPIGLWFEYGENQRFVVEQYPTLMIAAVIGLASCGILPLESKKSAPLGECGVDLKT